MKSLKDFSEDQIKRAREYAASVDQRLIDSIRSGDTKCRDPESYIEAIERGRDQILNGEADHNFTVWQRMYYFLTGESIPLLARNNTTE